MTATITRTAPGRSASNRRATARSASARPAPKSDPPKRPNLRVVDKDAIKRRSRRRVLLAVSASVVAAGLFSVALAYAQLAQGQRHLDALRQQVHQSEGDLSRLERDVVLASSPGAVVARAVELGMVRAENPVYLTAETPSPLNSGVAVAPGESVSQVDADSSDNDPVPDSNQNADQ